VPGLWPRIRPGHCGLTATSQALVREIEGSVFGWLAEKTVAKCSTALTQYDGTEKTMTFASTSAFDRFLREHASATDGDLC